MRIVLLAVGILAVLLLCLCRMRLFIRVTLEDGTPEVLVKIGFLQLMPRKRPAHKRQAQGTKQETQAQPEKAERKKRKLPKLSASQLREAASVLWPSLKRALDRTRRGITVQPLELNVTVGGEEEPAEAAKLYGELCGVIWNGMPVLRRFLRIPDPHIHAGIDFQAESASVSGKVGISVRLGTLLAVGITVAIPAVKWILGRNTQPLNIKTAAEKG